MSTIEINYLNGLYLLSDYVYTVVKSHGFIVDSIMSRRNIPVQTVRIPSISNGDQSPEVVCYLIHVLSESVKDFESMVLRSMYASDFEFKPLVFLMFDVSKVPDLMIENIHTHTDFELLPLLYTDLNTHCTDLRKRTRSNCNNS